MRTIVLGAAFALVAGAAQAADLLIDAPVVSEPAAGPSFYLSLHGGWWAPETTDATIPTGLISPETVAAEFTSAGGFRVGGAVGLELTPNLSIEGEVSYASTSLEEATVLSTLPIDGDVTTLSLMANAILGTDLGGWTPYVGVGAGAVNVAVSVPAQSGFGVPLDDDAWTWGAQFLAGVDFSLTEQLSVGARYRYQYRGDVELQDADDRTDFLDASASQSLELTAKIAF